MHAHGVDHPSSEITSVSYTHCPKCGAPAGTTDHVCMTAGRISEPVATRWEQIEAGCTMYGCYQWAVIRESWITEAGSQCERWWCATHAPKPSKEGSTT